MGKGVIVADFGGTAATVRTHLDAPVGGVGTEYCSNVTGVTFNRPGFEYNGQGQATVYPIIGEFSPPVADPFWGGVQFHIIKRIPVNVTLGATTTLDYADTPHGWSTGDLIDVIGGTGSWAALNGTGRAVTVVDEHIVTVAVNSSGFGAVTGTIKAGCNYTVSGTESSSPIRFPYQQYEPDDEVVTVFLLGVDTAGNVNHWTPGTTPSDTFTIHPPTTGATAGKQYCENVTAFSVSLGIPLPQPDGGYVLSATITSTAPTDRRYASSDLVIEYTNGTRETVPGATDIRLSPFTFRYKPTPTVQFVTFWFPGRDVNNRQNSIVDGVTPKQVVSQGTGSGQLDFAKALGTSLATYFNIDAQGKFVVKDLPDSAVASIAAHKILAGVMVSGVVYTGTVNASQINTGTMNAVNMNGGTLRLDLNGVTTTIQNIFNNAFSSYIGLKVQNNVSGAFSAVTPTIIATTANPNGGSPFAAIFMDTFSCGAATFIGIDNRTRVDINTSSGVAKLTLLNSNNQTLTLFSSAVALTNGSGQFAASMATANGGSAGTLQIGDGSGVGGIIGGGVVIRMDGGQGNVTAKRYDYYNQAAGAVQNGITTSTLFIPDTGASQGYSDVCQSPRLVVTKNGSGFVTDVILTYSPINPSMLLASGVHAYIFTGGILTFKS